MFYATDEIATHEEPWRSLFQIGLESLAYSLCGDLVLELTDEEADDSNAGFDVEVFARLTRQQKVAMLVSVGHALLERNAPSPMKSAVVDATFCSIIDQLHVALEFEVDRERYLEDSEKPDRKLRQTLLTICRSLQEGDPPEECERLPRIDCLQRDRWRPLIDRLQDFLLEDYDFDLEHLFCDDSPEQSAYLKTVMLVHDDYFTDTAPEPTGQQLAKLVKELSAMADLELSLEAAKK